MSKIEQGCNTRAQAPEFSEMRHTQHRLKFSVADPDPVGSGPYWSDPDPDVWDRIWFRIRALRNDLTLTFLVCVQAINTSGISVV
jgi:hypothetical protein